MHTGQAAAPAPLAGANQKQHSQAQWLAAAPTKQGCKADTLDELEPSGHAMQIDWLPEYEFGEAEASVARLYKRHAVKMYSFWYSIGHRYMWLIWHPGVVELWDRFACCFGSKLAYALAAKVTCWLVAQWWLCGTVVALWHSGGFLAQRWLCGTVLAFWHSGGFMAEWWLCGTAVALWHSGGRLPACVCMCVRACVFLCVGVY
eukprot:1157744-Pelagomonas_calceolata.AAC.2